ncbi:hypothetical protein O181_008874 [Austropuccinia psidii MF-1]|uniref:Uncharacterized protein n=1 Tax=Austropuccinia psidii MF-1 TaxID=1389203 RepID=A0A9Q3BPQ2_9BASI|nr:hypothetical protein [Austropuccinia psidii MF-1]
MEFIRGNQMNKEHFELPERLVKAIFDTLFTKSAHRWYIKLRKAHGHHSWTWWKTQIINQWANDAWRFKVETAFESAIFNADKDKALPWFCKQKDRLTELYPDMSDFMIHRKILRQCGDLHDKKYRYFAIGDNKCQKFAFIPFKRQITVNKLSPVNLELEKFKSEQLNEAEISLLLSDKQENELSALLYDHKGAYAPDKEPLGAIIGHEVDIIIHIERPYPPLLRRPAYPASPKSREALEIQIKELLDLFVIRKVSHNGEVEITTPVIVAWHNGKSRMIGDFRALNTYNVPDRYPIPKIQIALTPISQALYIANMDADKGFL